MARFTGDYMLLLFAIYLQYKGIIEVHGSVWCEKKTESLPATSSWSSAP